MKRLAFSYIWWPSIDPDIELVVKECCICQQSHNHPKPSPLYPWEWPKMPWERVHVDYAGPVGGKMILVETNDTL